jgi:glutamate-1-semialdehyde 2,1-aminomutase
MSTSVDILNDVVPALIEREEEKFRAARKRSDQLWHEAREYISKGVPSSFQDAPPQPLFVDRGKGSKVWDVDGNEYVDFHNGFGVMVVGHAHPLVVQAISERAAKGTHFAQPVADDIAVAKDLSRRFKQPQWRFTNSGTESTLDAVRIARGFTGRNRIVKIEATYHGHHDALMVSVEPKPDKMGPADEPASVPQTEGIPPEVTSLTSVIAFNNLEQLERIFKRYPDQIAALIVEPVMMNLGMVLPDDGYLAKAKEIAHANGALLIFDEVKTGCTLTAGGATEHFGVVPDLVTLAKAIGGGVPCGAVGGRADVMGVIDSDRVAQYGTFNGNPLTMAAARATLTHRHPHAAGVLAFRGAERGARGRTAPGHLRVRPALPRHRDRRSRGRHVPKGPRAQLPRLPDDRQALGLRVVAVPVQPRRADGAVRRGELDPVRPALGGGRAALRRQLQGAGERPEELRPYST